jgi:protein disulfide-isomerase A1
MKLWATGAPRLTKNSKPSRALEPEWLSAQKTAKDKLISIDCSADAQVCRQFDVSSFPTIRFHHRDGIQTRYRGPRKVASITAFLRRSSHPAVSYVTDKNVTAFHSIDDVVIVGRFKGGSNLRQQFMTVAEQYSDRFSFALGEPQQGAQMECFNNPDDIQRATAEFPSPVSIEAFVKLCSTPLIPELTRRNELSFYEVSTPLPKGKLEWNLEC